MNESLSSWLGKANYAGQVFRLISKNLTFSEACLQLTEISKDLYFDEGHHRHDCLKIACIRLSTETCLTFCKDLHQN